MDESRDSTFDTCSSCDMYMARIKELEEINELHRILNGELREAIRTRITRMDRDRQAYEERYGERVIYCTRHKMSGIDGCIACDGEELEEREVVTCVTCQYKSKEPEDFVHVNIQETGKESPVCQGCYDNYMGEVEAVRYEQREAQSVKATALADRLNTDYFE